MPGKHSAPARHSAPTPAQPNQQAQAPRQTQPVRQTQPPNQAQQYVPQVSQVYGYGFEEPPRRRRRGCLPVLLVLLLVAAVVGAGAYFFIINPRSYDVTVNGEVVNVERDATIADVIEAGYATPNPGNLIAIDGSIATEGGGDAFAATVNGNATTDASTVLKRDDVVEITDGADQTETYTETEEAIPHGTVESDTSAGGYWAGSLHVYQKGEDGLRVTRTGDVSGVVQTEEVKSPVDSGYHIYTADVGEDKVIALTFDDGPWETTTDQILDVLEANGAKATFFTIGNQISYNADKIQREHDLGCQVCTHTWDHASGSGQGVNITYMSADEQINEIQQGYAAIKEVLGEEPSHVTRSPGGNYYGETVSILEPYIDAEIGWDVDTEDWRLPGADAIYERIMSVQPGQVILCHDGGGDRSQTVEAVSRAVPELVAQGYKFVTIDELLAY